MKIEIDCNVVGRPVLIAMAIVFVIAMFGVLLRATYMGGYRQGVSDTGRMLRILEHAQAKEGGEHAAADR